jgi:signal transduction histidine kinase
MYALSGRQGCERRRIRRSGVYRAVHGQVMSPEDDFISMISHELRTPLDTMRLWAARKEIELTFTAKSELGVVLADPDRIQQVVWDLLSNAVKFTPSGGHVQVEVGKDLREKRIARGR